MIHSEFLFKIKNKRLVFISKHFRANQSNEIILQLKIPF